jgi:type I restriction enzyme M protein
MANGKDKNNGGNLGFEADLFKAADKLRGNMEPSDYKHVALGLIFLKYISDAFEARHAELLADDPNAAEDKDEYLADNIFWVPRDARWSQLKANARRPEIGTLIDDAMRAIEKDNESLKGVLPKDYARPALNKVMLGELIDLISGIALNRNGEKSRDVLGRVYEYFLGQFAGSEGKRGGEFYTPRSVVRVLVEMLEPYRGRVYDPCCGSGGMFVQSEKFVLEHGGRVGDIAIYGQESNYTTWRLAKMNLAVRGIDADIRWNNEGSFHKDELRDLRFDHILANPPFNISDWGGERLREDPRWRFGAPGSLRHRRRGAGQRLHEFQPERRRRHSQGHGRSRCRGLHGGPARATVLLHADSRLPVVSGPRQVQRQARQHRPARPARRSAVHRRAKDGHAGGPYPSRADGR